MHNNDCMSLETKHSLNKKIGREASNTIRLSISWTSETCQREWRSSLLEYFDILSNGFSKVLKPRQRCIKYLRLASVKNEPEDPNQAEGIFFFLQVCAYRPKLRRHMLFCMAFSALIAQLSEISFTLSFPAQNLTYSHVRYRWLLHR